QAPRRGAYCWRLAAAPLTPCASSASAATAPRYAGAPATSSAAASWASPRRGGVGTNVGAGGALVGRASGGPVRGTVLSGNGLYGVLILGGGTTGNVVAGNLIGLGPDGAAVPNQLAGLGIGLGASANTVGGPAAASRNVISGNGVDGVLISGKGTA